MTASKEQLQLMLYDGAIRYSNQARDAIEKKDFETSYDRLTRAQNIMMEMINGLNYDINRELCERMASIYMFVYKKLLDANMHHNTSDIDDALKVLSIERETWQMLVDKVNQIREGSERDHFDASSENETASVATDYNADLTDDSQTSGLSVEG